MAFKHEWGDGTKTAIFHNGTKYAGSWNAGGNDAALTNTQNVCLGGRGDGQNLQGKLDDVRISKVLRSDAWLKATHYALADDLLSFGAEESIRWARKCKITIDETKVAVSQTDFPVLLTEACLPPEMFDADGEFPARSDGGDIRFTSDEAGTISLAREIVHFTIDNDSANGKAEIWVKTDISSATPATTIWVWYHNPAATEPSFTDTYGRNAVWSNGFVAVWHMQEDPSGTAPQLVDSTGNGHDGTQANMEQADRIDAKVGKGWDFDGVDERVDVDDADDLDGYTAMSIEFWINAATGQTGKGIIGKYIGSSGSNTDDAYQVRLNSSGAISLQLAGNDTWSYVIEDTTDIRGQWYHIGILWSTGAAAKLVKNSSIGTFNTFTNQLHNCAEKVRMACMNVNSAMQNHIDATLDEVRICNVRRTTTWVEIEYNNQSSPGTFATAGNPKAATGWGRRCKITISGSKIAGATTVYNFIFHLNKDLLPGEMFDADGPYPARADGGDVRFAQNEDQENPLPREVAELTIDNSPANGYADIYVRIPQLEPGTDKDIWVFYNNPNATEPVPDTVEGKYQC